MFEKFVNDKIGGMSLIVGECSEFDFFELGILKKFDMFVELV